MRRPSTRVFARAAAVVAVLGVCAVLGLTSAWATSQTRSKNPDLTVTSSVSPDRATTGDTVGCRPSAKNSAIRLLMGLHPFSAHACVSQQATGW